MYRPSQTPHPTLSSARIASQNKLLPKTNKKPYSQKLKGRNPITPGRTASQTPQLGLHKLQHKNQAVRGSRFHEWRTTARGPLRHVLLHAVVQDGFDPKAVHPRDDRLDLLLVLAGHKMTIECLFHDESKESLA